MPPTISWIGNVFCAVAILIVSTSNTLADSFGSGDNRFEIDFVPISAQTNPTSGYGIVNNDYRMGVYEITNSQWTKFQAELGLPVTGSPAHAYDEGTFWNGANIPTTGLSWHEAAQFVNWLNTSSGHHPAYKFTGTQGTDDYTLAAWGTEEADNGVNLYRHKDAFYYLPTEDEWVKAAYWNGTALQAYGTSDGLPPIEDDEANYRFETGAAPWEIGSGREELNGTFDMMGNVFEWMEGPHEDPTFDPNSTRALRGGAYNDGTGVNPLSSSERYGIGPGAETNYFGFRVACDVPEPASIWLITVASVVLARRRR